MNEKYILKLENILSNIIDEKIQIEIKEHKNKTYIIGFDDKKSIRIIISNEMYMKIITKYQWVYKYYFDENEKNDILCQDIILHLINI